MRKVADVLAWLQVKRILLILTMFVSYTLPTFSQDTTFKYYNKGWQECNKDTAYYYSKIFEENGLWAKKELRIKDNLLLKEGTYLDRECKKGQGILKSYWENGTLKKSVVFELGKKQTATSFYESGKKKGEILYTGTGSEQHGWDENGVEVPDYIVEKEAMFPGGMNGWKSYLEKKLDPMVAARANAPIGIYTVKVQFIVDKDGSISNVQAIEVPEACKPCGKEAVRIIKNGPKWEAAIEDNKKVLYQALQYLSWQVSAG